MNWLQKDIKETAREYWLVAQGVPTKLWDSWKNPFLFSRVPPKCQICGRAWRPDMERYKEIHGEIIQTVFGLCWFNQDFGLVRETGHALPHKREICRDCMSVNGYLGIVAGQYVMVPTRKPSAKRSLLWLYLDVKYWTKTVITFFRLYIETWANFIRQPRHYIKCRKAIFK